MKAEPTLDADIHPFSLYGLTVDNELCRRNTVLAGTLEIR